MAGVGFQLRRLLRRRSFSGMGLALTYGAALAAGPWLVTVASIVVLFLWVRPAFGIEPFEILTTTIMYAFAASLIISGPWVMLSTRYAADQLFLRRREAIQAGVHASMVPAAAGAGVLGGIVIAWAGWSDPAGAAIVFRLLAATLLVTLSLLWILIGTVSYVRWYRWVALSFAVSGAVSVGAAYVCGRAGGLSGVLGGYLCGFLVLLACLYALWRRRYAAGPAWDARVYGTFRRWTPIGLVGLFYQLGVWADKMVLWAVRGQAVGHTPLRDFPPYDVLTFLAYLSVVPILAYFLISVETNFFARYRLYLGRVRRGTLHTMWECEGDLRRALHHGLGRMAEYQAVLTFVLCLAAEPILGFLQAPPDWPPSLFRWLLVASGCQALLLTVVLFLLYFELRWEACAVTAIFCTANLLCTAATAHWPLGGLGAGYAMAAGGTLLLGVACLEWRMRRITFLLFTKQPVLG